MKQSNISKSLEKKVRDGVVIPAMPLALNDERNIDERNQKAILRYYLDAGVGGIAVGVHSTQFEIRDPDIALFKPVLNFASEVIDDECRKQNKEILKIAGICGKTDQAVSEATFASESGYHAGLLSLTSFADAENPQIIRHCQAISEIIPLVGFYLQPAVGGRVLDYAFWREFVEIENAFAIKIAPFNRYYTHEVVRAVCDAGREDDIILFTGNDDNILMDLLTEYRIHTTHGDRKKIINGGLLGHWAVWTEKAVQLLEDVKKWRDSGQDIPKEWLTLAAEITDSNSAFFDTKHHFKGSIPGIHEVLRRQGLMQSIRCLDPDLRLSPGQKEEIDRVYNAYPHLNDDSFVKQNLNHWLED